MLKRNPERTDMSMYTVHKGRRYRAAISLRWWEQVATNKVIAQQLRELVLPR